jgi:plasmid stabilization system protein ParE
MKFRVRPAFYLDLEREQLWLLENAGATVADRWHDAVWDTLQFLQTWPEAGRLRHDLKFAGVRSWRVSKFHRWLIFYGLRDRNLILYRVVRGEMNLSELAVE